MVASGTSLWLGCCSGLALILLEGHGGASETALLLSCWKLAALVALPLLSPLVELLRRARCEQHAQDERSESTCAANDKLSHDSL